MDSVNLAVAGIAFFVIGIVGFVAVALFFAGATIRFEVLPRLKPLFARATADARNWVTPPQRPTAAFARTPVRTTPRR